MDNCIIWLTFISTVFGATVIDSGQRTKDFSQFYYNDIVPHDDECSSLTPELIKEIKAHQPLVDQITSAVVNGKYSGDTWNA